MTTRTTYTFAEFPAQMGAEEQERYEMLNMSGSARAFGIDYQVACRYFAEVE